VLGRENSNKRRESTTRFVGRITSQKPPATKGVREGESVKIFNLRQQLDEGGGKKYLLGNSQPLQTVCKKKGGSVVEDKK